MTYFRIARKPRGNAETAFYCFSKLLKISALGTSKFKDWYVRLSFFPTG